MEFKNKEVKIKEIIVTNRKKKLMDSSITKMVISGSPT